MNDIQSQFNARWWRQLAATPVMLIVLGPFVFRDRSAPVDPNLLGLGLIGVVVALAFSLWNWRCPGCNSYLGRRFFGVRHCTSCGAQLQP